MISPLDTYLGWDTPRHRDGCRRPSWDVAVRTDDGQYRRSWPGESSVHSCTGRDGDCGHRSVFARVTVRIVCHSCGAAELVAGEDTEDTRTTTETSTAALGYGLAPRQAAGLLLWAGQPWLDFELRGPEEPHDFVVTRTGVTCVTEDLVVGQITQGRGRLGGVVWTALAVPDPEGQYGFGQRLRWAHCNDGRGGGGTPLRTVTAAARWIGARLAEAPAGAA